VKYKIACVIPCFNESKAILKQLAGDLHEMRIKVIIVDDGSSNPLPEGDFEGIAAVLRNKTNQGLTYSRKRGIQYALDKGFDYIINMDADNQNPVENLKRELKYIGKYDIINLIFDKDSAVFSIKKDFFVYSSLLQIACGMYYPDILSEFRIFNRKAAKYYVDSFRCKGSYGSAFVIIDFIRDGFTIANVPGAAIYDKKRMRPFPLEGLISLRITFIEKLLSFRTFRAYFAAAVAFPALLLLLIVNLIFFSRYNSILTKRFIRRDSD
jgi:glycosyltransferase involved in cell wall biosynthesis